MYKLYKIDAVHDILKRVIKSNLDDLEMVNLYKELQNAGYEDKNIDLQVTKKIHQEGDIISINRELFDKLPDYDSMNQKQKFDLSIENRKLADARMTIKHIYGDNPQFPLKAELQPLRLGNDNGHLIAVWMNIPFSCPLKHTNVHWLEDLGFEFEQPTFETIPLEKCDDDLLSEHELIVKYMMNDNNWTKEQVDEYLKPVCDAMKKVGAVFYQP